MLRLAVLTILTLGTFLAPSSFRPPASHAHVGAARGPRLHSLVRAAQVHVQGGRALVLLPFAHQIGPDSGVAEIKDLQAAGFQVDVLRDSQVTIHSLRSLADYNVIYIQSHGGVNQYGEANLVSGQLVDNDAEVLPMYYNYSVSKATVAGEGDTQYWAILSNFFRNYVGKFNPNALIYVDTCGLLRATQWWDAVLENRGAGVIVSWDNDSQFKDNLKTSPQFFDDLLQGDAVYQALQDVKAAGLGVSTDVTQDPPVKSHLGYVGHGGITLENAVTGAAPIDPTATPTPTSTAKPTSTPTVTPVPTVTPTPKATDTPVAPLPLAIQMQPALAPGARQVITVKTAPGSAVRVQIDFPNGTEQVGHKAADAGGTAVYRFHQRASLTTHRDFTAKVLVTVTDGLRTQEAEAQYRVLLGSIDLSAEPRSTSRGGSVELWVHTRPLTPVTLVVSPPSGQPVRFRANTGAQGWAHHSYRVGGATTSTGTARVTALASSGGRTISTETTFAIH